MPSDCQCSACSTKIVKEVLNNKDATKRLRRLEKEVEELREKNKQLERRLKKVSISKRDIVRDLKKHLDKV